MVVREQGYDASLEEIGNRADVGAVHVCQLVGGVATVADGLLRA